MSYVVARMQKNNTQNIGGMQKHNQREFDKHSNKDIDKEKSSLNYDLVNKENVNYRDNIMDIINSQRDGTKKIRKDAVLVNEFIVTSDTKFFENLSPDQQKKFFSISSEWFKERYGEKNIAFSTVHNDETTPHMHLGVVPMRDGKLQGKNVFNRAELLYIQDNLPLRLKACGFDIQRGKEGSDAKHTDFKEWKTERDALKQEIETLKVEIEPLRDKAINWRFQGDSLKQEVEVLKKEKETLKNEYERYRGVLSHVNDEPVFASKRKVRNEKNEIVDDPEHLIVKKSEFQELVHMKKYVPVLNKELEEEKTDNLVLRKKVSLFEKSNYELGKTVEMARKRMDKLIENGSDMFSRCITYASKFYGKNKEVAEINKNVLKETTDDPQGLEDYKAWQIQNRRHQQQRMER